MAITIDDVKQFFKDNADNPDLQVFVKELVPEKPLTTDLVQQYLSTAEGKALIQPLMDKRVTDALETFKKKTFESEVNARVAAEMLKRNPEETQEQKRIRELEESMKRSAEERAIEKLQGQIKDLAFKEQVPPDFIADIPFSSPEQAALYIRRFKQQIEDAKTAKVNELIASGFKPGTGNQQPSSGKKDLSKLTFEEMVALEESGELDKR